MTAGTAGALGALGIILALSAGGKPIYVMPLVFGCAPVVNVFVSMYFSGISLRDQPIWRIGMFTAGIALVSLGAVMVLLFQPKSVEGAHGKSDAGTHEEVQPSEAKPSSDESANETSKDADAPASDASD